MKVKIINKNNDYLIVEWDIERFSKVYDSELNEEFQEARKYDSSLLISKSKKFHRHFWKPQTCETIYQIYHETNPDKDPYQARYQMSGSGSKETVIAYLHGIINGSLSAERKLKNK